MSSSALEPYRPAQPPAVRAMRADVRASLLDPAPRRSVGGAGWFLVAVIVFVSFGLFLTI
jgi:hypothetical protein